MAVAAGALLATWATVVRARRHQDPHAQPGPLKAPEAGEAEEGLPAMTEVWGWVQVQEEEGAASDCSVLERMAMRELPCACRVWETEESRASVLGEVVAGALAALAAALH